MDAKELTVAENLSSASLESEKTIENLTAEIQYYLVQMGQNAIEIGKRLILAKAKLSHGEWQNWLEDNFNLSYRTAVKSMAIAERFSKVPTSALFSQSQMVEMLSLPEAETEKFIEVRALEGTPVDSMSIKKLREEIKKYKSGLTESKQEKNVEVEMADALSTDQMPVVLSASQETEDAVTAVEVEEKLEVSGVDLEIPNGDIKEKVEEMPSEYFEQSAQEENFVGIDIPDKENEKLKVEGGEIEPMEQFFKFLPLILSNVNLKSVVEKYAAKDLKELEKQLGQLAAVHTEIENCLENWKKQQGAEMERQAVLSELKQIGLNDKEPFKKSKYVRDSIAELGFESVHKVPTKELLRILNEVKTQ